MIGPFRQTGHDGRVIRAVHAGDLEDAAGLVDITAAQPRLLLSDASAVIGKAGSRVLALIGRRSVRPPIQRIDGTGFGPGRSDKRLLHFRRLAIEADDHADVVRGSRRLDLGIFLRKLLRTGPADGIDGNQLLVQALVAEVLFQQTVTHVCALREPGQDDRPSVVLLLQIVSEGGGNITVGQLQIGLPLTRLQ